MSDCEARDILSDPPYVLLGMQWTRTVVGMPTDTLGLALGGPSKLAAQCVQLREVFFAVVWAMLVQVFRFADEFQILWIVVQCVAVLVMDSHATRDGLLVGRFPDVTSAKYPDAWFSDLDECTLLSAAAVPGSDANRADRESRILAVALVGFHAAIIHAAMFGASLYRVLAWKSGGGYGKQRTNGEANENSRRERIWFSPHCLRERTLFDLEAQS